MCAGVTAAEKTAVADGTYTGTAPSFGLTGPLTAEVTLAGGKITDIKVVSETDSLTGEWFGSAEALLIPRIIESQSLAVDAITGATTSSNGIRNAVAAAIDAAGGDSLQWYTEVPKKDDTVVIDDYDVIVVGMGGSGVFSYCAAADQGATVFGIEAAGKSSFFEYSLPQALIRFKQGFGRLIRTTEDSGVFCVLDRRIVDKRYGKSFWASLPGMELKCAPTSAVAELIRQRLGHLDD